MTPLPLDPEWRAALTVAVFFVVYLGMFFGGLPRLRFDRMGVAVLSAVFSNDVACLAVTPIVARIAWRRG